MFGWPAVPCSTIWNEINCLVLGNHHVSLGKRSHWCFPITMLTFGCASYHHLTIVFSIGAYGVDPHACLSNSHILCTSSWPLLISHHSPRNLPVSCHGEMMKCWNILSDSTQTCSHDSSLPLWMALYLFLKMSNERSNGLLSFPFLSFPIGV